MFDNNFDEIENLSEKRNKVLEELSIFRISKFFENEIKYDEIKKRLSKSGFNGIYVLSDKEYEDTIFNPDDRAIYEGTKKRIITSNSTSKLDDTMIHEMVHAIIDNKLIKTVDGTDIIKGIGIEEGIASSIAASYYHNEKNFVSQSDSYPLQVMIVNQINQLYDRYNKKKYSSFMLHALKEPESILNTIFDIYFELLKDKYEITSNNIKEIENIAYRSANDVVSCCDLIVEIDRKSKNIYSKGFLFMLASQINYNYLVLTKEDMIISSFHSNRTKHIYSRKILDQKFLNAEEILLTKIFNTKQYIDERVLVNLDFLTSTKLTNFCDELEDDIDTDDIKIRCLKK